MSERKPNIWITLDLLVGREWRRKQVIHEDDDELLSRNLRRRQNEMNKIRKSMSVDVNYEKPPSPAQTRNNTVADHLPFDTQNTPQLASRSTDKSSGYISLLETLSVQTEIVKPLADCSFSMPVVRARLERLMGSNMVRLTDRKYMMRLQERIREDYVDALMKRIAAREALETEREKKLVLTGKIKFSEAPQSLYDHPVLVIERYCKKIIAEKRARMRVPKVIIPKLLFLDESEDPPTGLTIAKGHHFNLENSTLLPDNHLETSSEGYMFEEEEYEYLKYENPLIKQLKEAETVQEMYELAEEIVGDLKTMEARVVVSLTAVTSDTSAISAVGDESAAEEAAPEEQEDQ